MYSKQTQEKMEEAINRVLERGDFGMRERDWRIIHKADRAMVNERLAFEVAKLSASSFAASVYTFAALLSGTGRTPEEAWADAVKDLVRYPHMPMTYQREETPSQRNARLSAFERDRLPCVREDRLPDLP